MPLHPMGGLDKSVDDQTRHRMFMAWQFHPRYWLPLALIGIYQMIHSFYNPAVGWKAWARGVGLVCIGIGTTYALIGPHIQRRRLSRNAAAASKGLLERHLCPSCGYKLTALPIDPDGCTICPECGAAWRLPEFGSGEGG